MQPNQQVALVTGAARGIGKAIASALARQGYCVIGTAKSSENTKCLQDWFGSENVSGQALCLDLANEASIESFLAELSSLPNLPCILINNAGIVSDNLLIKMSVAEWSEVIQVNLTGLFHLSKCCLKHMLKAKWGRIINIGSVVAHIGNSGQANYAAAKAGMEGFMRALAIEVGSRNITVNTIAPGFIATDMTHDLSSEQVRRIKDKIPLGRLGSPEEVASLVKFLVSDEAAYITGQTIHINGGLFMG